jgi:hypothetical protein
VIFGPANDDRSITKPTTPATKKGIHIFFISNHPTPAPRKKKPRGRTSNPAPMEETEAAVMPCRKIGGPST